MPDRWKSGRQTNEVHPWKLFIEIMKREDIRLKFTEKQKKMSHWLVRVNYLTFNNRVAIW